MEFTLSDVRSPWLVARELGRSTSSGRRDSRFLPNFCFSQPRPRGCGNRQTREIPKSGRKTCLRLEGEQYTKRAITLLFRDLDCNSTPMTERFKALLQLRKQNWISKEF
jgi:hypothetical protein